MSHNVSLHVDALTARTTLECALQRAENLAILGVRRVIELCVGPSLSVLEDAYDRHGIEVIGNDIDHRWKRAHPNGAWSMGDALDADLQSFDAAVFAPPLSAGCSGCRDDALMVEQVTPGYAEFLRLASDYEGIKVLVLPGRAMATSQDRRQTFTLLSRISGCVDVVPLVAGRRRITKYYDAYIVP